MIPTTAPVQIEEKIVHKLSPSLKPVFQMNGFINGFMSFSFLTDGFSPYHVVSSFVAIIRLSNDLKSNS